MTDYLYRVGDGNEGNFPHLIIELGEGDNPYAALEALFANTFIMRRKARRMAEELRADGEPEYGLHIAMHEGPHGQTAFGAAFKTAELQPLTPEDRDYYIDMGLGVYLMSSTGLLDSRAARRYKEACKR